MAKPGGQPLHPIRVVFNILRKGSPLKIRFVPLAVALALAGAGTAALWTSAHAEEKVLATINGKPITEADVALADSEIGADMGASTPEDQKKMSLIEFLIDNQLFAEAAEGEKLGEGADFEKRVNYLKRRALRELYFDKVIKGSVSDTDARKIYDDQVKLIKPEEEVSARHILVDSEDRAKELKEKLKGGADFAQLAKENSKDPGSKENGGDLGYFGHGQMVPEFEEAAFKLGKGEVSDPIKTQFGWHLLKVEDKRTRQPPPFETVKDRIVQNMLLRNAQQSALKLRSAAKIEFVDPEIKKAVEARDKAMEAAQKPAEAKPADAKPEDKKMEEKK
jgi:peptidyl-prolyl cis-trans isomerase C